MQVLHSNLASVKLDAAALRIIKAAYAFVALQGEAVNKTILIQTEKQRLRIKSAGVAPETLQGPGAMHARRWWVYDSKAAAKQRVVLLPVGRAEPSAAVPLGPKAPHMPRQLATMATMAPARLPTRSSRASDHSS